MQHRRESADILVLSATAAFHSTAEVDHAHSLPPDDIRTAYEVGSVAKVMELPVFFTEHSLFSLNVIGALHLSKTLTSFVHTCNQIIAGFEVHRENLHARMGRLSNLMIVPNGIDPDIVRLAGHPPAGRSAIVAVTGFERRRGGELLPKIVKSACQAEKSARWILMGGERSLGRYANL
jgi:hypothetical protein